MICDHFVIVVVIIIRHAGFLPLPPILWLGVGGISEWGAGEAFIHSSLQVFPLGQDSNLFNCSLCKCYANAHISTLQSSGKVKGGLIPQVSHRPGPSPSSHKEKQVLVP